MLNATHLFEQPARHRHNSESWWSAFFSLVLLYRARTDPSFSLPIYRYTTAAGYRTVGHLVAKSFSLGTVAVEAPLSAIAFRLAAWPVEFIGLKPDLSIIEPERLHALRSLSTRMRQRVHEISVGAPPRSLGSWVG